MLIMPPFSLTNLELAASIRRASLSFFDLIRGHEIEALDQPIFNRVALKNCHVKIVRILQRRQCCPTPSGRAQTAQLADHGGARLPLLRRQDHRFCGKS